MGRAGHRAGVRALIAGAVVCGAGLAGQAAAAPPAATGIDLEKVDPSGQTVVFWYHYTRERKETLTQLIEEFNATNPHGIKVRGEYMGSHPDIHARMTQAARQGSMPQLVDAYHNQAREYLKAGAIVDLTPYMASPAWGLVDTVRADYLDELLAKDNFQGVQVAFRPHYSFELLYYNEDWLRELGYRQPPRTWVQFAEMCRKARAQPFSRSADATRTLGFMLEEDASRLASMVFSRGGLPTICQGLKRRQVPAGAAGSGRRGYGS
ncbi:MAG: extracellular solute-binding protein [Candidatus Latescibacterota bacterium]